MTHNDDATPVRYAVIGQGFFAQAAVLPAFAHAENARLVALVSDDPEKLNELGDRYHIDPQLRGGYEVYDMLLASGQVDAVYIALPNDMHRDFCLRAAANRIHVLCEKPMAPVEEDCQAMIQACATNGVQLMIGYRLHFEAGNLTAIRTAHEGEIGEPRIFSSVFSMQVREGNIRTQGARAGGPLNDIGIYCINAARYIFRSEPTEVMAYMGAGAGDPRFREVEECVAATLRFPGDRIATFVASFAAADIARYEVIGTEGTMTVNGAYEWSEDIHLAISKGGKSRTRTFPRRDQVAAELVYFSRCIREDQTPEPSGYEGLADVRIMEAIRTSARTGRLIPIQAIRKEQRPDLGQSIHIKPHGKARLVNAQPPSK
jgi:predicted dehydrogenase